MNAAGRRAWVVDDSKSVRDSTRALFESAGIETIDYPSGQDFLDHFETGASGCLVADFHMPQMTGLELLREIRARGSQLPVIIITGRGDHSLEQQVLGAGALVMLHKPVDDDQLLALVGPHLGA